MSLEERIVDWAATRPAWQRDVMRRVAGGASLGGDDHEEILDALVSAEDAGEVAFTLNEFPQRTAADPTVSLVSVSDPEHVNALQSEEPLTFERTGLTIVYGDNGSGKSGYARLLGRIARARRRTEILTDVFRDSPVAEPTAAIAVRIGEDESTISWPDEATPELQRMLFYDSECGGAYVSVESEFPYRPSALFVLDGLIETCIAVRELADERLAANARAPTKLPLVADTIRETPAGRFLRTLSHRSREDAIPALLEGKDLSDAAVEALTAEEARLSNTDPRTERQRLLRRVSKFETIARHLERLGEFLTSAALHDVNQARVRLNELQEAADLLARSFQAEPLGNVGSSPWKTLWEAARKYSTEGGYPGRPYPAVDDEDRCVLCQQPLQDEGRERLRRFQEFVTDDTQTKLAAERATWRERARQFQGLEVLPDAVESNLQDLAIDHGTPVERTRTRLQEAEAVRDSAVRAMASEADLPTGLSFAEIADEWSAAAASTREAANALQDQDAFAQRISAVAKERTELELLRVIAAQRDAIAAEIERLKERHRIEEAKAAAATTSVTRKVSELSEESVTEVVRDAFIRESDRLLLERVTITRTRAERGALLHQPKLVGARQDAALPRVFSEGERTALGLAAFFAEAALDGSRSALILDDPVSSLDHVRRRRVAARVAELGQDRQVVAFTHDVAFVADLKKEADRMDVTVAERSVVRSRGGDRKPGTCTQTHPWKAKDVRDRINELKEDLARMRRNVDDLDEQAYEAAVGAWAGKLSETWERIFSQEIVGQILAGGGTEVRPRMVRVLAAFTSEDDRQFQASYGKVSEWAQRHDKSVLVNYVAPELDDLATEIDLVEAWFNRVRRYGR